MRGPTALADQRAAPEATREDTHRAGSFSRRKGATVHRSSDSAVSVLPRSPRHLEVRS